MGHLQSRLGPMRTGWHGLLQPIADAHQAAGQGRPHAERRGPRAVPHRSDARLRARDPRLHGDAVGASSSPETASTSASSSSSPSPRSSRWACCSPAGRRATSTRCIGGFRAAAQQISYEVPMILAALGVVMLAGSMKLSTHRRRAVTGFGTSSRSRSPSSSSSSASSPSSTAPVRPARGRVRARRRLQHRVLEHAVRALLRRRVHEHVHLARCSRRCSSCGGWNGPRALPATSCWLLAQDLPARASSSSGCARRSRAFRVDQLMTSGLEAAASPRRCSTSCSPPSASSRTCACSSRSRSSRSAGFVWIVSRLGRARGRRRACRGRRGRAREVAS